MPNAIILSTGSYAPDRIVPNSYFDTLLGEDVSTWLEENVHIYERRWAAENQSTADLCIPAARQALERARLLPEDIDLLIIATDTPEFISPSTSSKVQYELGLVNAGTFDINTACAGFVTALDTGAKYIKSDAQYRHVMVIGAYAMSKYLNMSDKKTVTLFADGAGAVILKSEETTERGFLASQLITQGQYYGYMGIYAGGTYQPITPKVIENQDHLLKFVQKFPKELNPGMWSKMATDLTSRIGTTPDKVDHYFLTQININSIWETMDRLGVARERAHTVMHYYGYTGSACIPMAFDQAVSKGLVKRGELIVFIGSGGGLAFASAAFIY
ncbi:MAG TPA: ketoacyl-ACP synthase III [Bacteroidales bacterium]|jgi:3-oxoacyl-[acyl-carrier-protein] synthase-3|nr:ketoacyl-ACP synthase III [Lentimicrobium sp.]HAH57414.1 ketoacyl-ACP synthase III [Bacteroidales bacterium]